MQDRPTAVELLEALGEFLEDEVSPSVEGPVAYRTRVAANLVNIVTRELELGPEMLVREQALLDGLVDLAGFDGGDGIARVSVLSARLTERLADGDQTDSDYDERARSALERIARDKLAVARPGYDAYDSATELADLPEGNR